MKPPADAKVLPFMMEPRSPDRVLPLSPPVPVLEGVDGEPVDVVAVVDKPAPGLDALPIAESRSIVRSRSVAKSAFHLFGRCLRGAFWTVTWLFGAASLMIGLAVLAALPILQFLSLGYLLEAGG